MTFVCQLLRGVTSTQGKNYLAARWLHDAKLAFFQRQATFQVKSGAADDRAETPNLPATIELHPIQD